MKKDRAGCVLFFYGLSLQQASGPGFHCSQTCFASCAQTGRSIPQAKISGCGYRHRLAQTARLQMNQTYILNNKAKIILLSDFTKSGRQAGSSGVVE